MMPTTVRRLITASTLALLSAAAAATTLYDPTLGTLPSAQGWITAVIGGPATQSVAGDLYNLDTTATNATYAGSALFGVPALDIAAGFTLDFSLAVLEESHGNDNRGGFSVVFTGQNPKDALEIDFWTDHVWVQTSSFTHGTDAAFDATALTDYSLTVQNQQFDLSANGVSLFGGALTDLTSRGFPYTSPGSLAFSDNSASASAIVELGDITLTAGAPALTPAVPEPATTALLVAGLAALAVWRRPAARDQRRGARSSQPHALI